MFAYVNVSRPVLFFATFFSFLSRSVIFAELCSNLVVFQFFGSCVTLCSFVCVLPFLHVSRSFLLIMSQSVVFFVWYTEVFLLPINGQRKEQWRMRTVLCREVCSFLPCDVSCVGGVCTGTE